MVSVGVPLSFSIYSLMGRFLGLNVWAVGFIVPALTEMGVVTEVVVEMVLTTAEL